MVGIGWQAHVLFLSTVKLKTFVRGPKKFKFTSPLLDVVLPEGVSIRNESIHFSYKIKSSVDHIENSAGVAHVSVYFRDLNDGPWFGINDDCVLDAASMMKVPVMIAWLKRSAKNPIILATILLL